MRTIDKNRLVKELQACTDRQVAIDILTATKLTKTGLIVTLRALGIKGSNLHAKRKAELFDRIIEQAMGYKR